MLIGTIRKQMQTFQTQYYIRIMLLCNLHRRVQYLLWASSLKERPRVRL